MNANYLIISRVRFSFFVCITYKCPVSHHRQYNLFEFSFNRKRGYGYPTGDIYCCPVCAQHIPQFIQWTCPWPNNTHFLFHLSSSSSSSSWVAAAHRQRYNCQHGKLIFILSAYQYLLLPPNNPFVACVHSSWHGIANVDGHGRHHKTDRFYSYHLCARIKQRTIRYEHFFSCINCPQAIKNNLYCTYGKCGSKCVRPPINSSHNHSLFIYLFIDGWGFLGERRGIAPNFNVVFMVAIKPDTLRCLSMLFVFSVSILLLFFFINFRFFIAINNHRALLLLLLFSYRWRMKVLCVYFMAIIYTNKHTDKHKLI